MIYVQIAFQNLIACFLTEWLFRKSQISVKSRRYFVSRMPLITLEEYQDKTARRIPRSLSNVSACRAMDFLLSHAVSIALWLRHFYQIHHPVLCTTGKKARQDAPCFPHSTRRCHSNSMVAKLRCAHSDFA